MKYTELFARIATMHVASALQIHPSGGVPARMATTNTFIVQMAEITSGKVPTGTSFLPNEAVERAK